MKAIAVGSMRPKAAGSGERTSVVVRSGSVRLGICRGNQLSFVKTRSVSAKSGLMRKLALNLKSGTTKP